MLKNKKTYIVLAVLAMILGFAMTLSFQAINFKTSTQEDPRYNTFINFINELEDKIGTMEQSIVSTREEMNNLQEQQTSEQDQLQKNQDILDYYNLSAGFTKVTGPGITITLDDNTQGAKIAQKKNPDEYYPENYIIHDKDLLYLLKELAQNIEAIAINSQRVVDSSNIRCVGTVIMVDSTRLAPPYKIEIIGDPDKLEAVFLASNKYLELSTRDLPITIETSDAIILPAYTGTSALKYLKAQQTQTQK